jgi:uncharacterized membrane protein
VRVTVSSGVHYIDLFGVLRPLRVPQILVHLIGKMVMVILMMMLMLMMLMVLMPPTRR